MKKKSTMFSLLKFALIPVILDTCYKIKEYRAYTAYSQNPNFDPFTQNRWLWRSSAVSSVSFCAGFEFGVQRERRDTKAFKMQPAVQKSGVLFE